MQLFACWKSLLPAVPMEKHAVDNEMEGISLGMLLDVMQEIHRQKLKCTFERIYATFRLWQKNVGSHSLVALLEQAVAEKVVEKRVANNITSYHELGSVDYRRKKAATSKHSSLVFGQLSDAVVSIFAAEGSTDSKLSLSLKCIEQKISSEGRIRVLEGFDWSRNIRLVCKQLVTRGILQQKGAKYNLVPDAGDRGLNESLCASEVISKHAGITQGLKQNCVGFSKIVHADNNSVGPSSSIDCKLVSNEYRVIGEVLPSDVNMMHRTRSNYRVCNTVQKVDVKRKTQTLLRHAQKPTIISGRKNLLHKKYQLRSSVERAADAADEPFGRQRKFPKGCKWYTCSLGFKQPDMEGQIHLADGKDKTVMKDADNLSALSAERFKQSPENLCHNTSKVLQPDKSCSVSKRSSAVTRRSIQNHTKSNKSVLDAVASSLVDSLGQPVVNLCRIEFEPVTNDKKTIPVDDNCNDSTGSNSKKDSDDINISSASTRKIPSYQFASTSELHGNRFNEVKKTLLSKTS